MGGDIQEPAEHFLLGMIFEGVDALVVHRFDPSIDLLHQILRVVEPILGLSHILLTLVEHEPVERQTVGKGGGDRVDVSHEVRWVSELVDNQLNCFGAVGSC